MNKMNKPDIQIIDQTIREGMQFRGLMLSLSERKKLLDFQGSLGIDISQAAYPPAHESEKDILGRLKTYVADQGYHLRVAGLGRALKQDVDDIASAGIKDIHLTVILNAGNRLESKDNEALLVSLKAVVDHARSIVKNSCIGVSILDIGKHPMDLIRRFAVMLVRDVQVNVLTLPDTSGVIPPNLFYDRVHDIAELAKGSKTRISVHCHNDMGVATANTVMGVAAGARAIEVTALGIGERNGIGDLFLAGKLLKDQGFKINLNVDDIERFREYYRYVNQLCMEKINTSVLSYQTPFFGASMRAHVAGTHGKNTFGLGIGGDDRHLNVLCGKHLVTQYLDSHGMDYPVDKIHEIVFKIKDKSVEVGRSLTKAEVEEVVAGM